MTIMFKGFVVGSFADVFVMSTNISTAKKVATMFNVNAISSRVATMLEFVTRVCGSNVSMGEYHYDVLTDGQRVALVRVEDRKTVAEYELVNNSWVEVVEPEMTACRVIETISEINTEYTEEELARAYHEAMMEGIEEEHMADVVTFPATAFNTEEKERLEEVLISLLDSGTIEEDVAMAMNECNTLHALRSYRDEVDADTMENIINVVTGKPMVVATKFDALANVDLREFFTCKTPEEARCLQSWAEAFGAKVTIKPNLVVVDNAKWDDIPF